MALERVICVITIQIFGIIQGVFKKQPNFGYKDFLAHFTF